MNDLQDYHSSQVEFNSETMIIHDHKEEDDYVKRMCIILNENLESTFPPPAESKEAPTPLEKTDKVRIEKSKRPSLEHSKIFELLKSQERKDFSISTSKNFKVGFSPDPKVNLNISPESIKKEFKIGSSNKKRTLELAKANSSKVEKNIIALLEEIDKDVDSKQSSPNKELYKANMKNSLDLENINADFNGIQLNSDQKIPRKPLQDISNKALDFATAESQTTDSTTT
jgi:hypothetical protein